MRHIRIRNDVQMGGRCTHLYIHQNENGTRMYRNIVADGMRLYRKLEKNYIRLCARGEEAIAIMHLFFGIYTQMGALRGLRDLPDKCVCDTNAYLARNSRSLLHPMRCLLYFEQDCIKDQHSRMRIRSQRGLAYD